MVKVIITQDTVSQKYDHILPLRQRSGAELKGLRRRLRLVLRLHFVGWYWLLHWLTAK